MPVAPVTDWGQAIMTSIAAALAMFLGAIPKVIGFAVILIVGWIIASLIATAVAALLQSREVQRPGAALGLQLDSCRRPGSGRTPPVPSPPSRNGSCG